MKRKCPVCGAPNTNSWSPKWTTVERGTCRGCRTWAAKFLYSSDTWELRKKYTTLNAILGGKSCTT